MLLILAVSLALTLIFELGFALIWGIRGKRELSLVILVNCLTNPLVVLLHYQLPGPPMLVTAFLECGAVLAEAGCYRACSEQVRRPLLFSLLCNGFSYLAGCLINQIAF